MFLNIKRFVIENCVRKEFEYEKVIVEHSGASHDSEINLNYRRTSCDAHVQCNILNKYE